jgi:hypothetical protein
MYTAYLKGSLKLSKIGEWRHNGEPFQNQKVSDLFLRSVVWDDDAQEYFIQIGAQRASFDCEDTAFFISDLEDGAIPWNVKISDATTEVLKPETLTVGSENQIYCLVHATHRARFSRSAHQALLRHAISETSISVNGAPFTLKKACDAV